MYNFSFVVDVDIYLYMLYLVGCYSFNKERQVDGLWYADLNKMWSFILELSDT
jgi:hypothetical protein